MNDATGSATEITRSIAGRPVSAIALGGASWPFSDMDDEAAVRSIHTAIDHGVTMIDTARAYTRVDHPGHSEAVIAQALASHPRGAEVFVATKGGHYRDGDAFPIDARRDTVRRHCETSLELLGVERIDLYQLHWPDPEVPVEDAMRTFAELRDEGLISEVGVSNFSIDQLEEARAVVPIASVQNSFSPFRQDDRAMLDHCAEHGIAYLSYSPLRGAAHTNLDEAFPAAAALAKEKGISIQRLALAWLLRLSPAMIPICGASRPETVADSAQAATTSLSDDELAALDF